MTTKKARMQTTSRKKRVALGNPSPSATLAKGANASAVRTSSAVVSRAKPAKGPANVAGKSRKPAGKPASKPRSRTAIAKKAKPVPSKKSAKRPATKRAATTKPAVTRKPQPAKSGPKTAAAAPSPPKKRAKPAPVVAHAATANAAGLDVRPRPMGGSKVVSREFLTELAMSIREAVEPVMEGGRGREVVGKSASGDVSFELDRIAEKALLTFLKKARVQVAYYSEDSGYSTFSSGQPKVLLVVDPIDGSRSAKSGFESCVVSVATTRVIERPRMGDVEQGLIMELIGNRTFYAERGKGVRVYVDGQARRPRLSRNANLEYLAWTMTIPARPAELIFPTAARLIDLSSLKGGFFMCNSIAFSLTRLLTGQLDACVDFANRYLRDIPSSVEDHFINAGRGAVLGLAPYDIAAAVLIAEEAGCLVSDAYGNRLDDVLLLDSSPANQRSLIAASNRELYAKLLSYFDTRINQFEQLLKRRMG